MSWLRIREIVRKEFIQLFRDKKNRPLLVIAPFVQLLVFGYVVSTDVRDIRVAIFDQSRTVESRMLIEALDANRTFRVTHHVEHHDSFERLIIDREVDLAVRLNPDLSGMIHSKKSSPVQIIVDGSMSNIASSRIAYTASVINRLNQDILGELYLKKIKHGRTEPEIRTWYNPNLESRYFYVPAIVAVMVMIMSFLFTSMAIIREKEKGTIEQLIVTPMKSIELILGKIIPFTVISLCQMVVVTIFAIFWFELPFMGSAPLLLLGTCLFLLSTLGIGIFISTISATQQQAMMTVFFFLLPFFLFSGFVFPVENMPTIIQWFTYLNPLMYMLIIIRGIFLKGVGLEVLWPQYLCLLILGLMVFTAAVLRFRKKLD
ncbi:MAG: ABC transporter permease [Deltaproteobacteria bacterium]|nr:ABC transporter permease [Deltaproteobacteria bacterium]